MKSSLFLSLLIASLGFGMPGVTPREPKPQAAATIKVIAHKYEFKPSTITVTKGEVVRLEVTADDTTHGFEIKELGINRRLPKGQAEIIEFTPDKVGEFTIKCSVSCGFGHRGMKGKLVVVEKAK